MAPCMCSACICCYTAIDFDNFSCLCKRKNECLCLVHEACLATDEPNLGLGCTTNKDNKECCKLALYCCSYGLKTPEKLCAGAERCLCFKEAASFPFDEQYVKEAVCAVYGLHCLPECGCCGEVGTECPSLDRPLTEYAPAPAKEEISRD